MEIVLSLTVFLGLFLSTFTREILNYVDGTSARREDGEPGSKVTGEWSWMDLNGKEHTIRYIADTNGFRAFGDLVPNDWSTPGNNNIPQIGSSVVPAININNNQAKDSPYINPIESTSKNKEAHVTDLSSISITNKQEVPENDILIMDRVIITKNDDEFNAPVLNVTEINKTLVNIVDKSKSSQAVVPRMDDMKIVFIPGTTIVLLSKRLPLTFATEISPIGEIVIKPIPVKMTGRSPKIITGILTAPRAKIVLRKNAKAKHFESASAGRAPRPKKVDGMLNFDNFLRPSHLPNSNPKVSLTPDPKVVVPDYYDDYFYYDDYTTIESNKTSPITASTSSSKLTQITTTPVPATSTTLATTARPPMPMMTILKRKQGSWNHQLKTKKQRWTRSEESLEDSNESYSYNDDSDESK